MRRLIKEELGGEIKLLHHYGEKSRDKLDLSNPFSLLSLLSPRQQSSDEEPAVALIYLQGMIVDGDSDSGLFGSDGDIGGDNIRKALRMAARDAGIKAVVLRIDSPGGSALASEVMWQAARSLAEKKPLVVSIGGMAASGGYYVASAGDYIFADACAIVGSIGVVGGKFVFKDLFKTIGLNTESFSRGGNAELFSSTEPFTDKQRTMVTDWMKETYDQFTQRVMTNRAGKIKDIDMVARGRIFVARQAKDLGMVDAQGGTEEAIAYAAREGGLQEGKYVVRVVPAARTLGDILAGGGAADAAMPFHTKMTIAPDSILRTMPSSLRCLAARQMQMIQLLQNRPVMLVTPYLLTVK